MKLTKAQIKAFEEEDRAVIQQTEADIESGRLVEVVLTSAERRAIAKAAGEAAERYRKLEVKALRVTIHVKPKRTKSPVTVKTSAKEPGNTPAKKAARTTKVAKAKPTR